MVYKRTCILFEHLERLNCKLLQSQLTQSVFDPNSVSTLNYICVKWFYYYLNIKLLWIYFYMKNLATYSLNIQSILHKCVSLYTINYFFIIIRSCRIDVIPGICWRLHRWHRHLKNKIWLNEKIACLYVARICRWNISFKVKFYKRKETDKKSEVDFHHTKRLAVKKRLELGPDSGVFQK